MNCRSFLPTSTKSNVRFVVNSLGDFVWAERPKECRREASHRDIIRMRGEERPVRRNLFDFAPPRSISAW